MGTRLRLGLFSLLGALIILGALLWGLNRQEREPLLPGTVADRILIEKSAHRLTLYGTGTAIRAYDVSLGRGGLAPKEREGDGKVTEGRYVISGRNPDSAYHLSLRINYPDAPDIAAAAARGEEPGSDIMIHGIRNGLGWVGRAHLAFDWTAGCIAVTDPEIREIWNAVPDGTVVEIVP